MRLTDIPKHPEVLRHLADLLRKQDLEYIKCSENINDIPGDHVWPCVGFVTINEEDRAEIKIPIIVNSSRFVDDISQLNNTLPSEEIIRSDDGSYLIMINQITHDLFNSQMTKDISSAAIAHEVGHLLSGHLDPSYVDESPRGVRPTPKAYADDLGHSRFEDAIIVPLLNGFFGAQKEIEADIWAVRLVGLAAVIAMHSVTANYAKFLSIQMIYHNRVNHLLHLFQTDPGLFETERAVDVRVMILGPREIEELKQEVEKEEGGGVISDDH